MVDIKIKLDSKEISCDREFRGVVTVGYTGKYDGVVINTQIQDSNELLTYRSYNGTKISSVSRLFVGHDSMPDGIVEFTAVISFKAQKSHDVKFRASIIEQHKEIESDIAFAKYG